MAMTYGILCLRAIFMMVTFSASCKYSQASPWLPDQKLQVTPTTLPAAGTTARKSSDGSSWMDDKMIMVIRYCKRPGLDDRVRHKTKCIERNKNRYKRLCLTRGGVKRACVKFKQSLTVYKQKPIKENEVTKERKAACISENERQVHVYDVNTHICCGGQVSKFELKTDYCCHDKVVSIKKFPCCDNVLHISAVEDVSCCRDELYNKSTLFCYNNKTYSYLTENLSVDGTRRQQPRFYAAPAAQKKDKVEDRIEKGIANDQNLNKKVKTRSENNSDQGDSGLITVTEIVLCSVASVCFILLVITVTLCAKNKCFLKPIQGADDMCSDKTSVNCTFTDGRAQVHEENLSTQHMSVSAEELPTSTSSAAPCKENNLSNSVKLNNGKEDTQSLNSYCSYYSEVTLRLSDFCCESCDDQNDNTKMSLDKALNKQLKTGTNNVTSNLFKDNASQTFPIKKSNKLDSFGEPFKYDMIIYKNKRTVQLDHSEVKMTLPEEDLERDCIECLGSSHSDVQAIRQKLGLRKDEPLASPTVEFILLGIAKLLGYAVIRMPFCGMLENLHVWRAKSNEGESMHLEKEEVPKRDHINLDLDTFYIADPNQSVVYIYTKVFSLYTCTCGNEIEISLTAYLYGNMKKIIGYNVQVRLVLFILSTLYKFEDYHWKMMEREESYGMRKIEWKNVHLPKISSSSDYILAYINLDQDKHWDFVRDPCEPSYEPNRKRIPLAEIIQCGKHEACMPIKLSWDLENMTGTCTDAFRCFLYVTFDGEGSKKTGFVVNDFLDKSPMDDDIKTIAKTMLNLSEDSKEQLRRQLTSGLPRSNNDEEILSQLQQLHGNKFIEKIVVCFTQVGLHKQIEALHTLHIIPDHLLPKKLYSWNYSPSNNGSDAVTKVNPDTVHGELPGSLPCSFTVRAEEKDEFNKTKQRPKNIPSPAKELSSVPECSYDKSKTRIVGQEHKAHNGIFFPPSIENMQ